MANKKPVALYSGKLKELASGDFITVGDITGITNSSDNSAYPSGGYAFNALASDGFKADGRVTGAQNGTQNIQRLQNWTNGVVYTRYWVNASSAWTAWKLQPTIGTQYTSIKGFQTQ